MLPFQIETINILGLLLLYITFFFINSRGTSNLQRVIWLILLYLIGGLILVNLDLYFIGLTYIIVYVGAIAILFLFIIMILQTDQMFFNPNTNPKASTPLFTLTLLLLVTAYFLDSKGDNTNLYMLYESNWYKYLTGFVGLDIHNLSFILFGSYTLILLELGLILWIILLGILSLLTPEVIKEE